MSIKTVTNWFGDLVSHPQVIVQARSVNDIVKILKDPVKYPSPVRAVGSNHSTAPVGVAEGGTLIKMSKMNRILKIGTDTVTVQAGAIAYDVAQELLQHQSTSDSRNLLMQRVHISWLARKDDGSNPFSPRWISRDLLEELPAQRAQQPRVHSS